jgi:deferrochelatase/peroxidase EfeB
MGVKPGFERYETNVLWNRTLREISQPKGQEIIGGRRKLRNEELQQTVDYKGHQSKEGEMDGTRSVYG